MAREHKRSPALGNVPRCVVAGELALCHPNPHSAVEAVGLAVLVRCSGPITQDVGAGEVEVYFPLPGMFGESRLV